MSVLRSLIKNLAFTLLDYRRQRGFHLMNDLKFWSKDQPIETVFDVGANIGQTTALIKQYFPDATVEAFEPINSTFDLLTRNCKNYSKVRCHQIALGSQKEIKTIRLTENSLTHSMLNEICFTETLNQSTKEQVVAIETVDDFCSHQGILKINLLKTDTEGFDLEVLKGAEYMLEEQRIDFVLSEVSFDLEDSLHTSFSEFNYYMHRKNYKFVGLYDYIHIMGSKPMLHFCNALYSSRKVSFG